jgi:uncharacterized membrane protein YhaH (DUF805 family)
MPERAPQNLHQNPEKLKTSEKVPEKKVPEKGLLSFIKTKLEQAVHPDDIKRMLLRAGFSEEHIHNAFVHVRRVHKDTHQDLAAINDFLPTLSKEGRERQGDVSSGGSSSAEASALKSPMRASGHASPYPADHFVGHSTIAEAEEMFSEVHKGLFAGRLRRKDFVLGFLFFFGLGYVILAFSSLILAHLAPILWQAILDTIGADQQGYLLMLVPVLLAPITVISLSLIARRLHNLGLPGGLAFIFLALFIPSFGQIYPIGIIALYFALLILFVVLVTVKGGTEPNQYGPLPGSKGSFFKRIFNI